VQMGLLQSHPAAPHYTGCSRDMASPISHAKSVQNSTVCMLSRVYNSVGSTERSSGHSARSSSQMSAQFRRALAKTESGSSVTWKRNGSQRCCRLSLQAGSQRRWCGCQYDLMNVGGDRGAHWSSWSAIPMLQEVATPPKATSRP
jgi:hypothetical protein